MVPAIFLIVLAFQFLLSPSHATRLGSGYTGNEIAVGTFTDAACSTFASFSMVFSEMCNMVLTPPPPPITYYKATSQSSGKILGSFGCTSGTCDSCAAEAEVNEGACAPVSAGVYMSASKITGDLVTLQTYTDDKCTAGEQTAQLSANKCTSVNGAHLSAAKMSTGKIAVSSACDNSCMTCTDTNFVAQSTCFLLAAGVYAKFTAASTGVLGKGYTGNEVAVGTFTDAACSVGDSLNMVSSGVCTYSSVLSSYFKASGAGAGKIAGSFTCQPDCSSCVINVDTNEGSCNPLPGSGLYVSTSKITGDSLTIKSYTDSKCTAGEKSELISSNSCRSLAGHYLLASKLSTGKIAVTSACDDYQCGACNNTHVVAESTCFPLASGAYAKFTVPNPGVLGKGYTGNEVAVGIFSDTACSVFDGFGVASSGVCSRSPFLGFFKGSVDAGKAVGGISCASDSCSTCDFNVDANEGACAPLEYEGLYGSVSKIMGDAITLKTYTDSKCTAGEKTAELSANTCTSVNNGYLAAAKLSSGVVVVASQCDSSCGVCDGAGMSTGDNCFQIDTNVYAKIAIPVTESAATSFGATWTFVALAAALAWFARA